MNEKLLTKIALSRILIGYLGENYQAKWWDCSFVSTSSDAFLTPIFPKSKLLAKYTGVCEAAIKIHDEYIGIGRHFHLYRLPDSIEQNIAKIIREKEFEDSINIGISSKDAAISELSKLSSVDIKKTSINIINIFLSTKY